MVIQHRRILLRTGWALLSVAIHAACVAAARPARPVERPPVEDEQIVSVPAATPAPSTQQATAPPSLKVLAVSVQPSQVPRGEQADLIVNYTVSGLAAGAAVTVEERRELVKDGTTIVQMSDTLTRVAGPHTSAKPVRVPADAAPGIYTLKVVLSVAGLQVEGTALFEVR